MTNTTIDSPYDTDIMIDSQHDIDLTDETRFMQNAGFTEINSDSYYFDSSHSEIGHSDHAWIKLDNRYLYIGCTFKYVVVNSINEVTPGKNTYYLPSNASNPLATRMTVVVTRHTISVLPLQFQEFFDTCRAYSNYLVRNGYNDYTYCNHDWSGRQPLSYTLGYCNVSVQDIEDEKQYLADNPDPWNDTDDSNLLNLKAGYALRQRLESMGITFSPTDIAPYLIREQHDNVITTELGFGYK
jgi:hypothetical protein